MFVFADFLRGLAALLVLWFHMDVHVLNHYPAVDIQKNTMTYWLVFGFLDLGKYAVAVFFMISGFLIPSTLRGDKTNLRSYIMQRFFRLYPAYWVSIFVWLLVQCVLGKGEALNAREIFANFTMLQRFFGFNDVIGAFWTLQIELVFYFICGLIFFLGLSRLDSRRLMYSFLLGGLLLSIARFYIGKQLPVALFLALSLMFFADDLRRRVNLEINFSTLLSQSAVLFLAILPICYFAYGEHNYVRYIVSYWLAILTFIFSYHLRQKVDQLWKLRKLSTFLASVSYGVYLLHDPIGMTIAREATGDFVSPVLAVLMGSVLTVLSAFVLHHVVEQPMIRIGKALSIRWADQKFF